MQHFIFLFVKFLAIQPLIEYFFNFYFFYFYYQLFPPKQSHHSKIKMVLLDYSLILKILAIFQNFPLLFKRAIFSEVFLHNLPFHFICLYFLRTIEWLQIQLKLFKYKYKFHYNIFKLELLNLHLYSLNIYL